MATNPNFTSTPFIGVGNVSTANTARDGTGTIVDIGAVAPAAGRKITSIVVKATGDPADSTVTIFLHDGTAWSIFDEIDLGDPAAASSTVASNRNRLTYDDLVLPSGWKIGAAITVALTAGTLRVFAFGGDLT